MSSKHMTAIGAAAKAGQKLSWAQSPPGDPGVLPNRKPEEAV